MTAMTPFRRRKTVGLLFANVVLFVLPMCAFLPAYTQWVIERRCAFLREMTPSLLCDSDAVSEDASRWNSWLMQACNIPNLLVALPLGTLVDRYGRRPLLLFNLWTQSVGALGCLLCAWFHWPLAAIVPTFIVNGIGGGSFSFYGIVSAALVDCSGDDTEFRALLLNSMVGTMYLCQAVGPVLGSWLTTLAHGRTGGDQYIYAFAFFAAANALQTLMTQLTFDESIQSSAKPGDAADGGAVSDADGRKLTSCGWWLGTLVDPVRAAWNSELLRPLSFGYCFLYMATFGFSMTCIFFAKEKTYDLDSTDLGYFISLLWLVRAAATLVLFPVWLRWQAHAKQLQPHHTLLLTATSVGLGWGAISSVAMGLVVARGNTLLLFVVSALQGLDGLCDASFRPLFSILAARQASGCGGGGGDTQQEVGQGVVFGIVSWVQVASGVIAPLVFNNLYAASVETVPGLTFYAVGLTFAIACVLVLVLRKKSAVSVAAVGEQDRELANPLLVCDDEYSDQ